MPHRRSALNRTSIWAALVGAILLVAAAGPARADAGETYFHAHTNAYDTYQGAPYNCQYAEWSSHVGACTGYTEKGNAQALEGWTGIAWCGESHKHFCLPQGHTHLTLPPGYSRFMVFCHLQGNSECHDQIIGAVKYPNGPFVVLAGRWHGNHLKPTSNMDESKPSHPGHPLFLYVGFHGYISQGGGVPAKTGYVFGLRGWLYW
jgi:hypothetical protein